MPGWDWLGCCESYPRETVNPSFEPQPISLMLKMRFLRRSGRKYEKSGSFGHGVSCGLAKNVCLVCANCEKSRKNVKKACKKVHSKSYPIKTVNPPLEPQPDSLMLKMRFLRRSGRKYEKTCSYGHGVSGGLAKNVC